MRLIALAFALSTPLAVGCAAEEVDHPDPVEHDDTVTEIQALSGDLEHGRDVWFNNTYGGEKFFVFLKNHPDPAKKIDIGFINVATWPRESRFDEWGVINDPDCVANPVPGQMDICPDPESSGVVGIRKKQVAPGVFIFGTTCASCHAGFDPLQPPDDPNEPEWSNIHATIGNSYVQFGKIFSANMAPTDPRRLLLSAWPPGSVDTTLLFDDGIMNPGVVTHFWEWPHRPTFDIGGEDAMRNGQGGEDDVGPGLAALRVYTNIGVCFQECVAPAVVTGQPISIEQCEATCADWPPAEDIDALGAFLGSHEAPQYPGRPLPLVGLIGKGAFDANCASCHSRQGDLRFVLSNDEVNPLVSTGANATNACRTLSTNWERGKLWAEFSSEVYKQRVEAGNRGYRTMPLSGIWATAPFLHNQAIGPRPPADAAPWERAGAYWEAMWELLSADRDPVVHRIPIALGPFPAGTPTRYVFSSPDPATGAAKCMDFVENRGHYYGSDLPPFVKVALIHWLQYQ